MSANASTHEVFNQSTPLVGANVYAGHRALRDALRDLAPGLDEGLLLAAGAELGSADMLAHARLANAHGPVLRTHDRFGRRIDEVEFHPSYHALMAQACQLGLHGAPWAEGPGAHMQRAAAFIAFTELEPSTLCPISMSYAVAPALRANAKVQSSFGPLLAARDYDARFIPASGKRAVTMGMGMTEKQGGSDVRANTTRAVFEDEGDWGRRYSITGHKWFFSAPMCDAFLVLAQLPAGLSCFFLPRWRADGSLNAVRIQRLKHKLGNQANASSEVEFDGAEAWLVGEEGRGVPQILAMGAITRLDCALGTAGLMRGALALALHHCAERQAFGRRLIDQPLMQNVLADLALEAEAATALAMRVAATVERSENGADPQGHEAVLRRVLTPIAKFWVCKRGAGFAQEAMECLGGNGYVEADGEGVMARIYREMPLNSIWEGAGNIMALDLLRALRGADVAAALDHEFEPLRDAPAAVQATRGAVLLAIDGSVDETEARSLARDLALLAQAACLRRHAPEAVFDSFCASRFGSVAADVYGRLRAAAPMEALIERAMPVLAH
jgi:putative acyl-CoA dehydrogenase